MSLTAQPEKVLLAYIRLLLLPSPPHWRGLLQVACGAGRPALSSQALLLAAIEGRVVGTLPLAGVERPWCRG